MIVECGLLLQMINDHKLTFDVAFTSVLKRAIKTLYLIQDGCDLHWIPVHRHWRLNERMYGSLQGLNKSETAAKHGEEQVKVCRQFSTLHIFCLRYIYVTQSTASMVFPAILFDSVIFSWLLTGEEKPSFFQKYSKFLDFQFFCRYFWFYCKFAIIYSTQVLNTSHSLFSGIRLSYLIMLI